ncbi:dihydroxy-acid dehydratase [Cyclonatronum proteinivorum]|uniref:Dihydroxy-acid dehydratase n=1 Tax=Cyclonatronum proteinivorum TaxID=1457365 RepID=A0A345UNX0_9BACT|nr:dihydroxy-acid dehydratase [Cyclonatronum proteinivorum]
MNRYSRRLTQDRSQAGSQAMLHATGLSRTDFDKAQVGIASMGWEGNPCNMHLNELAKTVKQGVTNAGLIGYIFHTIGVSDGISMGTEGMKYSLQSREVIADSIETVMGAQWYDGLVALPGCDKNMPGSVMAMLRRNHPPRKTWRAKARHCICLRSLRRASSGKARCRSVRRSADACLSRSRCLRRDVYRQHHVLCY